MKYPQFVTLEEFAKCGRFVEPAGSAPAWLVDRLIRPSQLFGLLGRRKSGKSYAALDLAAAVATGGSWAGAKVPEDQRGKVAFICAEGGESTGRRAHVYADWLAWRHYNDPASLADFSAPDAHEAFVQDVHITAGRWNLMDLAMTEAFIDFAKREQYRLVLVDSFRRATPGAKENSSDDLVIALEHCELIARETGAAVGLITHAGKDASLGARGSSVIEDQLETAFAFEKMADGTFRMTVPFARDGVDDEHPRAFKLHDCYHDARDPGMVVEWTQYTTPLAKGRHQELVLRLLHEGPLDRGALEKAFMAETPAPADGRDWRGRDFKRALNALVDSRAVNDAFDKISLT